MANNHFLWAVRNSWEEFLEGLRWKFSGDYDKYFWNRVQELRRRPDASPDNPRFVGDTTFASKLPSFLAGEPGRIRRWIEIAGTTYADDPLTQLIVGGMLAGLTFIGGHTALNVDRMCLLARAYVQMMRKEQAGKIYENALKEARSIHDSNRETFCLAQLTALHSAKDHRGTPK